MKFSKKDASTAAQQGVQNLTLILSYGNENGTTTRPPLLQKVCDYWNWKARFEEFISFNDPTLWAPILDGYAYPEVTQAGAPSTPKLLKNYTPTEREEFNKEKKARGYLTLGLSRELFHQFRNCKYSKNLWEEIQARFEGDETMRKNRKELVSKQFDIFHHLPNEELDD